MWANAQRDGRPVANGSAVYPQISKQPRSGSAV